MTQEEIDAYADHMVKEAVHRGFWGEQALQVYLKAMEVCGPPQNPVLPKSERTGDEPV